MEYWLLRFLTDHLLPGPSTCLSKVYLTKWTHGHKRILSLLWITRVFTSPMNCGQWSKLSKWLVHLYINSVWYCVTCSGMRLVFLPAYSPDLNPIEEAFSSIKAWIRANRDYILGELVGRHVDAYRLLWDAVFSVTAEKVYGWFRHSGYIA